MTGMIEPDRPHAGVEFEALTQVKLRRHLSSTRPAQARESHGAEQNRIGRLAALECRRRQRIAAAQKLARAHGEFFQLEAYFRKPALDGAKHLHAFGNYVGTDAVAGQHCNAISWFHHETSSR